MTNSREPVSKFCDRPHAARNLRYFSTRHKRVMESKKVGRLAAISQLHKSVVDHKLVELGIILIDHFIEDGFVALRANQDCT
jgi:hypothetical protein